MPSFDPVVVRKAYQQRHRMIASTATDVATAMGENSEEESVLADASLVAAVAVDVVVVAEAAGDASSAAVVALVEGTGAELRVLCTATTLEVSTVAKTPL